jgi:hypothetical protein
MVVIGNGHIMNILITMNFQNYLKEETYHEKTNMGRSLKIL